MTVINQNSISGITSITAASGSVQIFNSDGSSGSLTDLSGVNVSGVVTATRYRVGTAVTIDASGISATAGVVTATTYRVSAGTTAAPSITPVNDNNTGIFFPSDDTIAFGEGGAEAARFDSSGRFGLGTSAPSYTLDVTGSARITSASPLWLGTTTGDSYIQYGANATTSNNWTVGSQADGSFRFFNGTYSSGTERLRITSAGNVGIGSNSPQHILHLSSSSSSNYLRIDGSASRSYFGYETKGTVIYAQDQNGNASPLSFNIGGNEAGRFDTNSRLLVGTSSSPSVGDSQYSYLVVQGYPGGATGNANISLQRGETAANITSGEQIGDINFTDSAGYPFAKISCLADANAGTNDYPGRLVFSTTADGASSPTERVRIMANGDITFGNGITNAATALSNTVGIGFEVTNGAGFFSRNGAASGFFNRKGSDGDVISIIQDGVQEGTIHVSGTTVTLVGAHLSRWSQILGIDPHDKAVRPEILRGTVMSNLDEMCDWIDPDSGDAQANEQLNKTKISDVEGDKNVAGVFQSWDDDDDTWVNDYYLAMTGDFVIRIAAGVTVERGDLLMSAGDGTAKPQTDDALRSCTIAKVTSTHVSHTFDDGSYCVPCVLMAC